MIVREFSLILTLMLLVLGAITSYVGIDILHKDNAPLEKLAKKIVTHVTTTANDAPQEQEFIPHAIAVSSVDFTSNDATLGQEFIPHAIAVRVDVTVDNDK